MKKTSMQRQLERNFDSAELVGNVHVGRHGVAKRNANGVGSMDILDDEKLLGNGNTTVTNLYEHGNRSSSLIKARGYTAANTFIYHSPMDRTKKTAIAVALGRKNTAGLFGAKPRLVSDLESELAQEHLEDIRVVKQKDLGYDKIKLNVEAFKKGEAYYFEEWAGNPNSSQLDGVEVTPYNHMIGMGDEMLLRIYNEVRNGRPDGVVISHGTIAEAIHMAALNSTNPDTRENMRRMGGGYSMEDSSVINFYQVEKSGYTGLVATIRRETKNGEPVEGEEVIIRLGRVKDDLQYRIKKGIYKSQSEDTERMAEQAFAI